jgi:uncharacterized protein YneF (UPF0154 family)
MGALDYAMLIFIAAVAIFSAIGFFINNRDTKDKKE